MKMRLRKAVIGLMLVAMPMTINEMPSCSGEKGGGSGDLGHPNVKEVNPPSPKVPNPKISPSIKGDDPRELTFMATWDPERDMQLTWRINSRSETWEDSLGSWITYQMANKGDVAEFIVENMGLGGATTCAIYVNGILFMPRDSEDTFQPFSESTGAGDCRAKITVP